MRENDDKKYVIAPTPILLLSYARPIQNCTGCAIIPTFILRKAKDQVVVHRSQQRRSLMARHLVLRLAQGDKK